VNHQAVDRDQVRRGGGVGGGYCADRFLDFKWGTVCSLRISAKHQKNAMRKGRKAGNVGRRTCRILAVGAAQMLSIQGSRDFAPSGNAPPSGLPVVAQGLEGRDPSRGSPMLAAFLRLGSAEEGAVLMGMGLEMACWGRLWPSPSVPVPETT